MIFYDYNHIKNKFKIITKMDNSNSYFINSEKTIDDSKFNISKKSKFKKISLISPNNLYFQKNNSSSNIFLDNKPQTSLAKNYTKISNIYNKFTLSCLRKNKKYVDLSLSNKGNLVSLFLHVLFSVKYNEFFLKFNFCFSSNND